MTFQKPKPLLPETGEITLTDILWFFKVAAGKIITSIAVCFLGGATYYFTLPDVYEAVATIQMASVSGEAVETPAVLLEKIKLPTYFSTATMNACKHNNESFLPEKFAEVLRPTINKQAPFISFAVKANKSREALICLDAAIFDIKQNQLEIVKPIIERKKKKLKQLNEQLRAKNEFDKQIQSLKPVTGSTSRWSESVFVVMPQALNGVELSELKRQIDLLEDQIVPPSALITTLVTPIYLPEAPVKKRPLFIFGLSLVLGVFLGIIWGVVRILIILDKK